MSDDPKRRVVRSYLDDAADDLEMAELGAAKANRLAAFHLQQAAEKLVKAVRAHHDLRLTSSHDIDELVEGSEHKKIEPIPADDKWHGRLLALAELGQFATAFRYPSPTAGRRKAVPLDQIENHLRTLRALHSELTRDLV